MPTQTRELTVSDMMVVFHEVVLVMLGGIRQAFPNATQHDTDEMIEHADEAIGYLMGTAIEDFLDESEPDNYEFALDAIKEETTKLVKWYINLKPNYQSR